MAFHALLLDAHIGFFAREESKKDFQPRQIVRSKICANAEKGIIWWLEERSWR